MNTTEWVLIIGGAIFLIVIVVLLARGHGPAIKNSLFPTWNAQVARHVIAIGILIIALQLIKSSARDNADEKARDWLTQYNGKATTEVMGEIEADIPSLFSDETDSPSPTPSPSPLITPSPSPSPSPVETPSPANAANVGNTPSGTAASTASPSPSPTPTEVETARINEQLQIIRDRAKHHGDVMAFFYVNYFVSIVMVMTAGLLVAITLFFIAQQGWTGTNSYVKAAFIIASAYVAFYGLFPPVFQQQKNITDNKELFLRYKSLENEVDSYPITLLTLKGDPKTPKAFINHIDAEMDRLGAIALGFDITKVSYEEAFATRATPSPTAVPTPSPSPKKTN